MARQYERKSPPAPPISSGNGSAKSPSRAIPATRSYGKSPVLVVVGRAGRDLRLGEVAHHVPNVTLLVTEIEVHCANGSAADDGRARDIGRPGPRVGAGTPEVSQLATPASPP